MNCEDVAAILEVSDPARAPDPARLRDHLNGCSPCRERYPDVVWLLEARDDERPVRVPAPAVPRETLRVKVGWAAAAAVVLVAGWLGWQAVKGTEKPTERPTETDRTTGAPPAAAAAAVREYVGGDLGTVSYRTVTIDRGHRYESLTMTGVLPLSRPARRSGERRPH
jgi:hypothetical protein